MGNSESVSTATVSATPEFKGPVDIAMGKQLPLELLDLIQTFDVPCERVRDKCFSKQDMASISDPLRGSAERGGGKNRSGQRIDCTAYCNDLLDETIANFLQKLQNTRLTIDNRIIPTTLDSKNVQIGLSRRPKTVVNLLDPKFKKDIAIAIESQYVDSLWFILRNDLEELPDSKLDSREWLTEFDERRRQQKVLETLLKQGRGVGVTTSNLPWLLPGKQFSINTNRFAFLRMFEVELKTN